MTALEKMGWQKIELENNVIMFMKSYDGLYGYHKIYIDTQNKNIKLEIINNLYITKDLWQAITKTMEQI